MAGHGHLAGGSDPAQLQAHLPEGGLGGTVRAQGPTEKPRPHSPGMWGWGGLSQVSCQVRVAGHALQVEIWGPGWAR